ncbi:MAG: sigma-54 dependent transcriptional regulator [Bryobacteraceae bacterium]
MEPRPIVIAILEDQASLELIRAALCPLDAEVVGAADAEAGWELVCGSHAEAILLEARLAAGSGLLERITERNPGAQVLLLTDTYSPESAMREIAHGAADSLPLPFVPAVLQQRVADMLRQAQIRRETLHLDERLLENFRFHGMVGRSPAMLEIFARIRRVAPHYRVALITGATGTGKELVAQALHALSPVANRRLAICNCSAIVESLFESELFGHVRGAFTGASHEHVGLFEYAHGGTVFLDEIGDMPLAAQSKLLRVLQNQELQRVGSPEVHRVDVRIIAATNRDLPSLVARNQFREDLYYRLAMVDLPLPRLAERKEDLPLLQRHLVEKFAAAYGKHIAGISRRAQAVLSRYGWPGNVRELENVLGHACMMTECDFVDLPDLPQYLRDVSAAGATAQDPELMPLADLERRYTQHVLGRVGGNKLQAAQILGISRATLYRILRDSGQEPAKGFELFGWAASPARVRVQ